MLDPNYAADPRLANGSRTWQVIFQWHQGDNDQGGSPPVALIIVGDHIYLDVETVQGSASVQVGQWPLAALDCGTRHDFAAEIKWHPTDGTIKVWHNGRPITFDPVPSQATPGASLPSQATDTVTGLTTLFPPQAGPFQGLPQGWSLRRAANATLHRTSSYDIRRYEWVQ
jgi:hypothetical protein